MWPKITQIEPAMVRLIAILIQPAQEMSQFDPTLVGLISILTGLLSGVRRGVKGSMECGMMLHISCASLELFNQL